MSHTHFLFTFVVLGVTLAICLICWLLAEMVLLWRRP